MCDSNQTEPAQAEPIREAQAVLTLLTINGAENCDGFTIDHNSVMAVLWNIDRLLTQAVQP